MSAFAALRTASRSCARPAARLVSGMRVSAVPAFRNAWNAKTVSRAFSASAGRFGSGTTDISLSQKIQEELKYEQEAAAEQPETPDFLKSFLEQGVWSIDDARGSDEVTLSRKFGDENIRLIFSIADMQVDEFEDPESGAEGEDSNVVYPIRASLTITKSNAPGSLGVDLVCEDNHFLIENISFYDDAKVGTELSAEADWKRRGLYIGPQFTTLDAGVQEEFEKYFQERGINETVAAFIPEYAAYKEQQEYVKWLSKVKNFVDL